MNPSFYHIISTDSTGTRHMKICDQEFAVYSYDWYIDDAITLAGRWKPDQITYSRILHLRNWIRENYQHDHNIPYKQLRSLQGCLHWVESVIHAEYRYADEAFKADYQQRLSENRQIFS